MSLHKQAGFLVKEAYRQFECHKSKQVFILDGGFKLLNELYSGNDPWGFTATDDIDFYVSFRGTEPSKIRDLLIDANIIINEFGEHAGFYDLYDSMRTQIESSLAIYGTEGQRIITQGHSAGRPLAVKAAHEFNGEAITFAGPKFVTSDRAIYYSDLKEDRIVNPRDIIPKNPFDFLHFNAPIDTIPFGHDILSCHSIDTYYEVTV